MNRVQKCLAVCRQVEDFFSLISLKESTTQMFDILTILQDCDDFNHLEPFYRKRLLFTMREFMKLLIALREGVAKK